MEHQKPSTALFDVFLRLRPGQAERERFLDVEETSQDAPTHITIKPPANDKRKRAVERFAFTRVFEENAGQRDIFETSGAVRLLQGVLGAPGREGSDGLLATLGVTGSGKSHTILGSKTQRGLTQLTLDTLFQHTEPHLANVDSSEAVFSSLCASDVAESQIYTASNFLDNLYGNVDTTRMSRATTPAMVRETPTDIPGAFPSNASAEPTSISVYDRLYPPLPQYDADTTPSHNHLTYSPSKSSLNPLARFAHMTRSIAKLTHPAHQESSFLSAPASSKRYMPRVSTFPQSPSIDDIAIPTDSNAEYAIVVSMYEVYNDRIFDLLTASVTSGKNPQKRRALLFKSTEASPDRKVVAGLRKVVCSSLEEALLVLETGLQERRVAGTGSNAVSSRSHGFFCLHVKKRHKGRGVPGPWTSSTMTIVDLAGSERARAAKTAGSTLAEAGKINESLMYLGQCMQMQSDNAHSTTPNLVPFRQCKLTELLFSNSFTNHHQQKPPQKAVMIVTADPLGDFNATSQILRYSALAREVTVPRIPSVTSTILSGALAGNKSANPMSRPATPSAVVEELENALAEVARLREELEITQVRLEEETQRRIDAEASWTTAEMRIDEVEAEIRDEVFNEMEARLEQEQRRWRAARDEELDRQDEHLDRKLEIMARGIEIYEDGDEDKENVNVEALSDGVSKLGLRNSRLEELEDENAQLREKLANVEREKGLRSPSKKMRVLKTRKWDGSGMGLDDGL
ncbi:hypothetical protein M409DRAFT_21870 [Zasmidium cellare ATCC 36951]|uniref:Kinesin-like protein n=1 Tax=Zasmidium cellare ATCC 36951 TaxID=1080233 RepID=A0A6A6CNB4_ZASCE|nr:uncharacterized protein M409DRAFT_21870 [Zasmidium cellare ATCC 36951]KAF2167718.1 hypothetical protein M409DRAFT_21870 [Zasmidium cellare ATCC 36951]